MFTTFYFFSNTHLCFISETVRYIESISHLCFFSMQLIYKFLKNAKQHHEMKNQLYTGQSLENTIKPVLRGHLLEKEKVVF